MASYNKVILMGNLTRDPEVRTTSGGTEVTEIGVATSRTYTVGGPGGEKREEVTYADVTYWGKQGELIAQHLRKGDPILVDGRLSFRSWEDKAGNRRSKLSVTGENFQFVGGRQRDEDRTSSPRQPAPARRPSSDTGRMFDAAEPKVDRSPAPEGFDEVPF